MSFAGIERKASIEEDKKKSKKVKTCTKGTTSPRRSNSLRRRESFAEAKLKTKEINSLRFAKEKKTFVEAKAFAKMKQTFAKAKG